MTACPSMPGSQREPTSFVDMTAAMAFLKDYVLHGWIAERESLRTAGSGDLCRKGDQTTAPVH